jgi:hypothetical protein
VENSLRRKGKPLANLLDGFFFTSRWPLCSLYGFKKGAAALEEAQTLAGERAGSMIDFNSYVASL